MDFFIDMDISAELRNKITDIFIGETYWNEFVRVSYGFGGEFWKIYAVNNLAQGCIS